MNGRLRNMASIYILQEDRILFLYRIGSRVVRDSYVGTAGGHFEEEELNDARKCVLRELKEETGLEESDLENLALRYVTLRLKNGEIRQNYYFFAGLKMNEKQIASNEGRLEWVSCEKALSLDMPYTAKYVIRHYLKEGRQTNLLYGGVATEDGVAFEAMQEF